MHLRGVPKEQIRNALGHHSWEFTESVYVHDDSIPSAGVLAGLGVGNTVGNTWQLDPPRLAETLWRLLRRESYEQPEQPRRTETHRDNRGDSKSGA